MDTNCGRSDLIILVNEDMPSDVLKELNSVHQKNSAWVTFTHKGAFLEVLSFYKRVFDLLTMSEEKMASHVGNDWSASMTIGLVRLA